MGYFAGARDLRNLLAVASKLRQLADDTLPAQDRKLYLSAAAALEARAARMATTLPGDCYDRDTDAAMHCPVDLII